MDAQPAYFLLPFRFGNLNGNHELIVNETGDYKIVPKGSSRRIILKEVGKDEELYKDLISMFFISESPIPDLIDILATKYRTKKQFLDGFTGLHIFAITLRCDHSCEYCQVSCKSSSNESYDMSYEHIDKAINLMFRSPSNHLTMEFQGGEPLLVFDKVKYAIQKAKTDAHNKKKSINFVICTNLSLVNDNILEFCKEYDVNISTSLDGPEYVHNSSRKKTNSNSYKEAIKNISSTQKELGIEKVSALMTTTKTALKFPIQIIDEYRKMGFQSIFLRPINPYGYALRTLKNVYEASEFVEFYKEALNYILELNLRGEYFVEEYTRIILKKILTPFNTGFVDLQSPSGIVTGVVVYNRDGRVYASDEARMLGEVGDYSFCLGHLDSSTYDEIFYGNKVAKTTEYILNESLVGCSDCVFQAYCGADPVQNHSTQSDPYGNRPRSAFCARNREIMTFLFNKIIDDPEAGRIFLSWATEIC